LGSTAPADSEAIAVEVRVRKSVSRDAAKQMRVGVMRRTVWVVVMGLLVLAVVAQSVALVERRPADEFNEFQIQPDGRVVKIRSVPFPPRFIGPMPQIESSRQRAQSNKKSRPQPDDNVVVWTGKVESRPLPYSAAYDDATDRATNLLMHELDLANVPSREYVRKRVVANYTENKGPTVEDIGETFIVKYDLELTREMWRELAQFERATRVQERMGGLARTIAIITVLLGCIAGYIRLDEYTKGYYTGRLRALTLALAVVASVGIAHI
jgi:hypothetical protein